MAKKTKGDNIVEIKVVTRLQDGGDGGYTMYVYNNEDELIADHPNSREFRKDPTTGEYDYFPVELTDKQRKDILTEDDPYNNGYIGKDTIKVKINSDGTMSLAEPLSFHAGQ